MRKVIVLISVVMAFATIVVGQVEKPAWNVKLESNKTARSVLTVQNRCKKTHKFDIKLQNISFLELGQTEVKVKGGRNFEVPVRFDTTNLNPQFYEGQVLVICKDCNKEPTCTQDREVLPVVLEVFVNKSPDSVVKDEFDNGSRGSSSKAKDPCVERCLDLLKVANDKDSMAKTFQDSADAAKDQADKDEGAAKTADDAAKRAEELATDPPRNDRAVVNGEKYTSADNEYQRQLQTQINEDFNNGKISKSEHQRRTRANTVKAARDKRAANLKKLRKAAKKARDKADRVKRKADKSKAEAGKAQSKADEAKRAANDARNAYNDCIKKAKEECDKLKAAEAKKIAEAKAAEDKRIAEAKAAEDAKLAEKKRLADAEKNKQAKIKERKRLLELIKKLGLIDKKLSDVPSIWGWLPEADQVPVSMYVENLAGVPIPTDTLKALGGLYGLIGSMLNPCEGLGLSKTREKLVKMINPNTGRNYTDGEAVTEASKMCEVLRDVNNRLKALKAASEKQR